MAGVGERIYMESGTSIPYIKKQKYQQWGTVPSHLPLCLMLTLTAFNGNEKGEEMFSCCEKI